MNNLVVTDAHFLEYKKKIVYECLTMVPKVAVETTNSVEYMLRASSLEVQKELKYKTGADSVFTFVGSINEIDIHGRIEVELLSIEEQ